MASTFGALAVIVLLQVALAIALWRSASRRSRWRQVDRHLSRQLDQALAPPGGPAAEPATADGRRQAARAEAAAAAANSKANPDGRRDASSSASDPQTAAAWWTRVRLPAAWEGAVTRGQCAAALGAGLLAVLAAALFGGPVAAGGAFVLAAAATSFWLWWRLQKLRRQLVRQLPGFIDAMVRLISVGNATHAAFQLSIATIKAPLRDCMEGASALVRAGVDLDQALKQMARGLRIEEMHLLAAILGLGVRYGGRSDALLERVAHFMRDREQAEQELMAMSAETRLSAWILGLLPIGVGGAIVLINPAYFARMWHDGTGQAMIFGAFGLQVTGVLLLYRLARLS